MVGIGTNAVATYIVMTCRPRAESALTTSMADFNRALRRELGRLFGTSRPPRFCLWTLRRPRWVQGCASTRYRAVIDQSGQPLSVDHALRLINAALGEVLDEQEGELDPESRFAVRWWETHGWTAASFGEANKTARPLGISVDGVVRAQVVTSQANRCNSSVPAHSMSSGAQVLT